ISRNGEGIPKKTDAGGNLHAEPEIKGRNLRAFFGDGKPDPGLDIIVRADRVKDQMSVSQPGTVLLRGSSAQDRHVFADGLVPPARQYDPPLRELRQARPTLPDKNAPSYAMDARSECPPEPTEHSPGNLMDHPAAPSCGLPVIFRPGRNSAELDRRSRAGLRLSRRTARPVGSRRSAAVSAGAILTRVADRCQPSRPGPVAGPARCRRPGGRKNR